MLAVLWWLPAAGVNVLKPYQTARLTGFTHPSTDPNDPTSYNLTQSMIAVGAGGAARGAASPAPPRRCSTTSRRTTPTSPSPRSPSSAASSAPRSSCCSTCSSSGAGCKIVTGARDLFGAIVAGGIVFGFLFQVFVNVGMTIGIAPITGIPLPFVSVGGSSMISNLVGIGILQAIARARRAAARLSVGSLGPRWRSRARAGGARAAPASRGRSSSAGARELVPLLAKELRAGGDAGVGRRARRRRAAPPRSSGSARPTRTSLRRGRARAACRSSGSPTGESLPYVLDTNLVALAPGTRAAGRGDRRARSPGRSAPAASVSPRACRCCASAVVDELIDVVRAAKRR